MILITGSILARPDTLDALREAGVEHSRRSRGEPGCLAHAVHRDVENPLRLVFVEQWADRAALMTHFRVPDSIAFVQRATGMAAEAPQMALFDATALER